MVSQPENILLLTATINPSAGIPLLARSDPNERRADYERALRFYVTLLGRCFDGIVFCENSGADLGSLRAIADRSEHPEAVEFISFKGEEPPYGYGRAFAEIMLIEHAWRNSEILRRTSERIVWKCTGRYLIHNMEKFVRRRPKSFDLYCHMRNNRSRRCELFMLAWNDKGYETAIEGIAPLLKEVPIETREPEILFRLHVETLGGQLKIVPRFHHVPLIEARRGWNNQPYSSSPWQGKNLVRAIALKLAPWLWI